MTVELHDQLQHLETWQSPEIPILSLYLNLRSDFDEKRTIGARLRNLLEPITGSPNDHNRSTRMSLRENAQRILDREPQIAANTGHCVAIFLGGNPERDEFLTLPRKAWDTAVAGDRPYLRPYLATLDQFHRIATLVVDPRLAAITTTYMGERLGHIEVESEAIRKADYAGWHGLDEHRVRHHAEEVHRRHYRQVADELQRRQQEFGIDVIFVGGRDETVTEFLHLLPPHLASLVAETFTIDVHTATPGHVAKITADLEERYEEQKERNLVVSVIEAARSGGGVIGVEPSLSAANLGAIDLLLISGTEMVPGYVCRHCGWMSLHGPDCLGCGETTSAVTDIIESLALHTRRTGATAEHVMSPSELGDQLVAARLRFEIPPMVVGDAAGAPG